MDLKYLLKIFIISFLILSTILFINSIGLDLNGSNFPIELKSVIVMEGLENNNPLTLSSSKAFCEVNKGAQQENACKSLTQNNCNSTSCCIWTSDKKCKAGNASGPLFGSDSNGKTVSLDYYYFQNQCYGTKCP